jgi:hypothetical protein
VARSASRFINPFIPWDGKKRDKRSGERESLCLVMLSFPLSDGCAFINLLLLLFLKLKAWCGQAFELCTLHCLFAIRNDKHLLPQSNSRYCFNWFYLARLLTWERPRVHRGAVVYKEIERVSECVSA